MLIHQKVALSTTTALLNLLRPAILAPRVIPPNSLASNTAFTFTTNTKTNPVQEVPKENFIDSIFSDLSYNEPEEFLPEFSYQSTKEYIDSVFSVGLMDFEELLDLLKYIAMSPPAMEKLSLTKTQLSLAITSHVSHININNVTVIVWALGKLEIFSPAVFTKAHEVILNELRLLKHDEVAIIIWSFAKLQLQSKKFWTEIIAYAEEILPQMSILDLQQIVWGLAKAQYNEESIWQALEDNIQKYLRVLENEQAISLFMMSFARMKQGSDKFWKALEGKFESSMHKLGNQALSNALWALARRDKTLVIKGSSLESAVIKRIEKLKDIEVASISWAFIKLGKGSQEFWANISQRISKQLEGSSNDFQLVTLCTFAWVLKSLKEINKRDWEMLEEHILAKQKNINANHLYSILASFAQKRQGSDALWRILERRTLALLPELDEKSLAIVIWCFATGEKGSLQLWKEFGENLKNRARKMTEQGLVISLWGFAKTRQGSNLKDSEAILQNLYERFDSLKPVDIGMLMWSLGKFRFKSEISREIVERVIRMIMEGYEMSLIDFIQTVYAISELRMGSPELWELAERIIEENEDEVHEEGWVLLVQAASNTRHFSDEFWERMEARIVRNINKYSKGSLVGFMNGFNKANRGSMDLWIVMEEAIKKDMSQLTEGRLTECATILSKRKISQNEFWAELETVLLERLYKMKTSSLGRISHSFAAAEQGSLHLWTELQKRIKQRLTEEKMISKETLMQILQGFSKKKKGDHQFWNILEKRLLDEIKIGKIKQYELLSIIREFSKVKRGSRELWSKVIEFFMANLDNINFHKVIFTIRSLDIVQEIDENEKEMIYNKCLDRVLAAEEDFENYLESLSQYKEICQRLTEDDMRRLSKKVVHMSKKAVDSSIGDKMKEAFDRISDMNSVIRM